jgi:hypothetical protein
MRLKLAVSTFYALGLCVAAFVVPLFAGADAAAAPQEASTKVVKLDTWGQRGVVFFDHAGHETVINPDPNWPFKAKAGAACVGCHHSVSRRGIPQLYKCNVCHHRREGDPRNPKNRDFDEVMAERAFHDSCIGCHRESNKGPVTCSGCHKSGVSPL